MPENETKTLLENILFQMHALSAQIAIMNIQDNLPKTEVDDFWLKSYLNECRWMRAKVSESGIEQVEKILETLFRREED